MRGYVNSKNVPVNFRLGIMKAVRRNGTWVDEEKLEWAFPHVPLKKRINWAFEGEKPQGPWINITALGKIVGLHWAPDFSYIGVNLITYAESKNATIAHAAYLAEKKVRDKAEAIRKHAQEIKNWETNCGKLVKEQRMLEQLDEFDCIGYVRKNCNWRVKEYER
jgi:hypothetical protein